MPTPNLPISTQKFRPATVAEALQALALLAALPTMTALSDEEMQLRKAAYLLALEGVSGWGLSAAVKAILGGSLGHKWMPSPSELCIEIKRLEDNERESFYRAERHRRQFFWDEDQHPRPVEERLLKDDPEGRTRCAKLWEDVRKSFTAKFDAMSVEEKCADLQSRLSQEPSEEKRLQLLRDWGHEKILISEALLRSLRNPMHGEHRAEEE